MQTKCFGRCCILVLRCVIQYSGVVTLIHSLLWMWWGFVWCYVGFTIGHLTLSRSLSVMRYLQATLQMAYYIVCTPHDQRLTIRLLYSLMRLLSLYISICASYNSTLVVDKVTIYLCGPSINLDINIWPVTSQKLFLASENILSHEEADNIEVIGYVYSFDMSVAPLTPLANCTVFIILYAIQLLYGI